MARPRGSKNRPQVSGDARPEDLLDLDQIFKKSEEKPQGFQVGKWYAYTGEKGILLDTLGRLIKWSVIKFEVVKMADGIIAVRFEDGIFDVIIDPELTDFTGVTTPRY